MLCQGKIQSHGSSRACWLPQEPNSPWHFCRKCTFQYVVDQVDSLIASIPTEGLTDKQKEDLCEPPFLKELLHVARHQSLFHLLSTLYNNNTTQRFLKDKFLPILECYQAFKILLQKTLREHHFGPRCGFYRHCMGRNPTLFPIKPLCWSCLAWAARQKRKDLAIHLAQSLFFLEDKQIATVFETPKKDLVDLFVSLELGGLKHQQQYLFQLAMTHGWNDLLYGVAAERCYQDYVFTPRKTSIPWQKLLQDPCHRKEIYKQMKKKRHSILYLNDEFIARTWHPRRLLTWCLDQEEIAEFG